MELFRSTAAIALSCLALASCQSSGTTQTAEAGAAAVAEEAAFAPAALASATPAQCAMPIAGPPPKPAKGADFASATGKNLGRNVGRNLIANMGGRIAGPIGGAVAGAVAADAIRSEQDVKGSWSATDGSPACGCTLDMQSGINLQGRTVYSGSLKAQGCTNPLLARAARWNLGHTFTGYDATFDLTASDGAKLATLRRDGVDYFSGQLADGTALVVWRQ